MRSHSTRAPSSCSRAMFSSNTQNMGTLGIVIWEQDFRILPIFSDLFSFEASFCPFLKNKSWLQLLRFLATVLQPYLTRKLGTWSVHVFIQCLLKTRNWAGPRTALSLAIDQTENAGGVGFCLQIPLVKTPPVCAVI